MTVVDVVCDSPLMSVAFTVAVYVAALDPVGPAYVCVTVAVPGEPARLPRFCDVPSPKSIVADLNVLLPAGRVTVKTTDAVLFDGLAAMEEQLPIVLPAGRHVIETIGPARCETVTALLVFVPAVALTAVCWLVVRVVRASPLLFVVAVLELRLP